MEDEQETCPAECVNVPRIIKKEMEKRGVVDEKLSKQVWEIHDLGHKLDVTKLEKAIEIEKNKPAITPAPAVPPEPKTREQMIMEAILRDVRLGISIFEIEKRLKAEADARHPEDLDARQQEYMLIEEVIFKYRSVL